MGHFAYDVGMDEGSARGRLIRALTMWSFVGVLASSRRRTTFTAMDRSLYVPSVPVGGQQLTNNERCRGCCWGERRLDRNMQGTLCHEAGAMILMMLLVVAAGGISLLALLIYSIATWHRPSPTRFVRSISQRLKHLHSTVRYGRGFHRPLEPIVSEAGKNGPGRTVDD